MKKSLLLLPALALLSGCATPETSTPEHTAVPGTAQELAAQLQEYDEKSRDLVSAVDSALMPGATRSSIEAQNINPAFKEKLLSLRADALKRFPELQTKNAWIGESTQLVSSKDLTNITPNLTGLLVVVTADPTNRKKTAVVAKLKVDVQAGSLTEYQLSDRLVGGYVHPALTNRFSGPMPYIRRVDRPLNSIDLHKPSLELMNAASPELIAISRDGQVLK